MNQVLINKILASLKKAGRRGMSFRELMAVCHVNPKIQREFRECLVALEKKGAILDQKPRLYDVGSLDAKAAVVTRLNKTYGFARFVEDDSEVFIPGKFFLGALPGDKVLVAPIKARGASPEGEIIKILKEGSSTFTGTLIRSELGWRVRPDTLIRYDLPVLKSQLKNAREGDKVLCSILERGSSHSEHIAKILSSYGDSQTAVNCAQAILDLNGIPKDFPEKVLRQAEFLNERGISESDLLGRTDLRKETIFTIDSADSKDLDDAVSVSKSGDFYELGVHIADVSHYVTPSSLLDEDAFSRGTSIYFADRVIPMLPKALSNGICSLNPNEDRLTFSCFMKIDAEGRLMEYRFEKSVIRSRIKGVYREINQILDHHKEPDEIKEKYAGLYDSIFLMQELADILTDNKRKRGAPEIETSESYIVLDENGIAVDILPRTRGKSEVIIEEFMLIANEAAASCARKADLPFVYRVHEPPTEDKLEGLRITLNALGISTKSVKTGMPAMVLSKLLQDTKEKPIYPIVNMIALRSMSKAKYFEKPLGHYGLVLENYAQFTSPIRRYPDLTIHRVLSEFVNGRPVKKIKTLYSEAVVASSRQSTDTELRAMMLERECEDCYKAEYMKAHIGEEAEGIISSVAPQGLYVELPNTIEGLIKLDSLPKGEYDLDGVIAYKNLSSGKSYRIGDTIRVICIAADVNSGNIDFQPALQEEPAHSEK